MAEPTYLNPLPRLLVVGAGAIANALLPRIIRLEWGAITLVDGDLVEEKNLPGQDLFAQADLGRPKSAVLAAWLRNMPITMRINHLDEYLDVNNVEGLISMHDVVADCTPDHHAKWLLDKACTEFGVTMVTSLVEVDSAQVAVLHVETGIGNYALSDVIQKEAPELSPEADRPQAQPRTVEATARRMAALLRTLAKGETVENGWLHRYDGKDWHIVAPPKG